MTVLIAGLGNPGSRFVSTRHNVGFWFADILAAKGRAIWQDMASGNFSLCELDGPTESRMVIVKPLTFMNRSGEIFPEIIEQYRPDTVLVATDNLDLDPGRIRMKRGSTGGGGHNGLRSVREFIGTEFLVLHIGVGRQFEPGFQVDYVLSDPTPAETLSIRSALDNAATALVDLYLAREDLSAAARQDRFFEAVNSWKPQVEGA